MLREDTKTPFKTVMIRDGADAFEVNKLCRRPIFPDALVSDLVITVFRFCCQDGF